MAFAVSTDGHFLWAVGLVIYLLSTVVVCDRDSASPDIGVNVVEVSGRFFELLCPTDDQHAHADWLKDERTRTEWNAYQEGRLFELRDGNLLVVDSKESDSGIYTCTLSGGESKQTHVDIHNSDLQDVCGIRSISPQLPLRGRIYGGDDSRAREWPWMAMIRKTSTGEICGGSLVDHYWVVTSAHCVRGFELTPENARVYLGKINRELGESHEVMVDVEEIVEYPDYDSRTYDADIALIRLKTLVQFNDRISPVCLPPVQTAKIMINQRRVGWATGWGRTEHEYHSRVLNKIKLKVNDRSICEARHSPNSITANMFCADSDDPTRDTCTGDGGGPFVRKLGIRWYLLGIISWGQSCASHQPGVFTRVEKFHDWIKETQRNVPSCHGDTTNSNREETTSIEEIIQSPICEEECGLTDNGQPEPESWPWMVQILRRRPRFGDLQKCNGVLIRDSWVVSLASCFRSWTATNQIRVNLANAVSHQSNALEYRVVDTVVHPSYNAYTRDNDVVLLKLAETFFNTDSVKPACVLKPDIASTEIENQVQGYVTGIGNVISLQRTNDETVQTIPFAVNTTASCNDIFNRNLRLTESMFCATTMSPTQDACGGFRGSPMVTKISGRWYVLGLVSWGDSCHEYPVVFSKLHHYHDWIFDVVDTTSP